MQPATLHKRRFPDGMPNPPTLKTCLPYSMGYVEHSVAASTGSCRKYIILYPTGEKEGQEFYKYERPLILQMVVRYGEKNFVQRSR